MAVSMTGFGRGEYKDEKFHFIVECKSVNHKYTDISVKIPRKISFLEDKVRQLVKEYIKRGRVDLFIKFELIGESDISLNLDINLAKQYYNILNKIKEEINVIDDISVLSIAKFPDVIKMEEKEEEEEIIWNSLKNALINALLKLKDMREVEGVKLSQDIKLRCSLLQKYIEEIESLSYNVVIEYKEKLENRIKELLGDTIDIDENRLSQEVAIYADRSNITEEIVRFKSHIKQIEKTIDLNDLIGRKIDFLIQEMNREINTIGSKSSNLRITELVVEVKSELEKIREQIQNIE
ncbi:YicC/YloC family endoribonuclease [Tepidibacter thalassicus]|uniref:TIGR00255 family protein n=1 Tax=Tepidibacter thalassicus DSM 15285 TaxID=1123350 RepID=A0A1M5Q8R4_9FIRM|nr:YicC/YloC family endoribonuclease [Tepidibacter thalassicus]SHH09863.1 TIGR00255 family protein [Tepidibacter thalassicus DSM 15285]